MVWVPPITSLLALAASLYLSEAKELDVYDAHITYPNKDTKWKVGEAHHVRWDTAGMPADTSGTKIYLVHNKRIDLNHVLADGFDYHKGEVMITVPSVTPGSYRVDLMGDSRNWSEEFQIEPA